MHCANVKYTVARLGSCYVPKELEGDASGGRIWPGMRIPTLRISGRRSGHSYSCRDASAHGAARAFSLTYTIVLSKARFFGRSPGPMGPGTIGVPSLLLAFHVGDASPGMSASVGCVCLHLHNPHALIYPLYPNDAVLP